MHTTKAIDPSEDLTQQIRLVLNDLQPDFLSESINVKELSGGITNTLYQCRASPEHTVLVRLYGKCTDKIIDRGREGKVFGLLHAAGHGPKFHGTFENGCVYGFIPGRSLKPSQLREDKLMRLIASRMGNLHSVCTPMAKEHELGTVPESSGLWDTIRKWIAQIPKGATGHVSDESAAAFSMLDLCSLEEETNRLEALLDDMGEPIVFGHNDLLAGNIIHDSDNDSVFFIDYEYADYNYRTFDVANHFCEFMGFEVNTKLFPTEEEQKQFGCAYLTSANGKAPTEEELNTFVGNVRKTVAASHLYWGVWALLQSHVSAIDFDFFGYSVRRLGRFVMERDALLK